MTGIQPLAPEEANRTVGITTTVPVEVIYAAGLRPLDLNNIFITSGICNELVEEAESEGFPRNSCAWNKGIYLTARRLGLRRIVGVTQGDCSNTHAMMEMIRAAGVEVIPFAFPYDPADSELLALSLKRFCEALGTSMEEAEDWKKRLDELRAMALEIDRLCWQKGIISGTDQQLMLISCSDFFGDPDVYRKKAVEILETRLHAVGAGIPARPEPHAHARGESKETRLALIGIPPIVEGLYEFLERRGARIVYNEVPRQFAMPAPSRDLLEQYSRYTYPYDIFHRLPDIEEQLRLRKVDGVIHYVQSFCFRQVQDAIIRRSIQLPILTLECDRPSPVDMRTETRIEAFLEMLG